MILIRLGLYIFLIAVSLGLPQSAFSQNDTQRRIDSVLLSLEGKTYNEQKEAYNFLKSYILKAGVDVRENFEYALSKDSTDLGRMVLYEGYSKRISQKGDAEGALQVKLKGLELAEKLEDEYGLAIYHCTVGNSYLYLNQADKALYHLNKAQILAEKPENKSFLWNVFYHKGLLQNMLGDIEGQNEQYLKMWEATKDYENSPTKRFVLYILVDHFSQLDAPLEVAKFTEILAELYEDAHPNTPAGHMPIKNIFENRADPVNIPRLKEAIAISDSLNSVNSMAYNTIALAKTYDKMNRSDLALPYLQRAIDSLKKTSKPQVLFDLYKSNIRSSLAINDFKTAYNSKNAESILRDSVTSERMQRNIAELEVKFDTEKKERKILEQNLTIEQETRQKNQILMGTIGLGLILFLTFIFFRKRLLDQRTIAEQRDAIQQQEITELQQKNKLLALNSMIEGQEAERLRIAKDLHDSLGGLLSTVKAHFSTIQREIEQLEKLNITEKTNNLIDEACIEVRRISHNMMPHALSISGLKGALEDVAENLKEQGYEVSLEISNLPEDLESTKEVMIYRLIQEIISNIRKHADAKTILIQLLGYKDEINLIVEDDGKGFDYDRAIDNGGLGLKSINSRVEFLDGKIHWDSQFNQGTTITINLPSS